jgi:hypothetical protein
MNLSRRSLLSGLIAAPAVILTPKLLMPVRSWAEPLSFDPIPLKRGSIAHELINGRPLWGRFVDVKTGRVLQRERITWRARRGDDHVAVADDMIYNAATPATVVPEIVSDAGEVLFRYGDQRVTLNTDETVTLAQPLLFG